MSTTIYYNHREEETGLTLWCIHHYRVSCPAMYICPSNQNSKLLDQTVRL